MTFPRYPCCPPRSLYTDITVKTCAINISSISVRPCSSSGTSPRCILFSSENFLVSSGFVLFSLDFFFPSALQRQHILLTSTIDGIRSLHTGQSLYSIL